MTWEAIGAVAEVVGVAVVIISLLYLSRQIRQNTEQSKINSSHAIDSSNMQAFDPVYIPENSAIWTKGHSDPDALDEHELQIFNMLMARVLMASFNTTSYHYSRGMFAEELYLMDVKYFRSLVATPGGTRWYASHREFMHAETQSQLDQATPGANEL